MRRTPTSRRIVFPAVLAATLTGCARVEQALGIPAGEGLTDALVIAAFALVVLMLYRRGRRSRPGLAKRRAARRARRRNVLPPSEREGGQDGGDPGE